MRQDENSTTATATRRATATPRDRKPTLGGKPKPASAVAKTPLRTRNENSTAEPLKTPAAGFKTPAAPLKTPAPKATDDKTKPASTAKRRPALSSIGANAAASVNTPATSTKTPSLLKSGKRPLSSGPASGLKPKPLATPRTPLHQTTGYARAHPSASAAGFTLKRIPESSARKPAGATPRAPVRSISVMMDDDEVGAVAGAVGASCVVAALTLDRPYAPPSPPASRKAAAMYAAVFPEATAPAPAPSFDMPPPHDPFAGDDFTFEL
ncbi:hypothetical protein Q8F55_000411 [Vanrija albida]|uniref:Uncharacterized protein n=1 Tax=Vanrija albida TaxID=181172 RepID=A0ABR3QD70_9TREE